MVLEQYPDLGMALTPQMPGRSREAVKQRARLLGVAERARRAWSAADDAQLRALYATRSAAQIADLLGRTTVAVLERARQIGARKHRLPLISATDFAALAARTRLWPDAREMARRILVDGITAAEAGREAGKSRTEASRAAWRVRAEALREAVCPTCGRPT